MSWQTIRLKTILKETKDIVGANSSDYQLLSLTKGGVIIRDLSTGKGKFPSDFSTYKIVNAGQIIFCLFDIDETPRTVGLSHHNGMITGAYDVFNIENANPRFIEHYFLAIDDVKGLKPYYTGLRKTVSIDKFLNISVPIPPRAEQDQIVRYLDWKVSRINKLINAKRRQIALLAEFVANKVYNILCSSANNTVKISKCATKIGSGKTPRGGVAVYVDTGTLFIRSQNVYPSGLATDNAYYITDEIDESMKNTRVFQNDVLLNITGGSIGRSCIYSLDKHANVNQHVCIIRPNKDMLLPEYLAYFLNSPHGQNMISTSQNEGNRQSLTFRQIGAFDIPLPTINEQERLLSIIHSMDKPIKNIVRKLNDEIALFAEYRTRLISDVVTGKLDVRSITIPNYEVMEEMVSDKIGFDDIEIIEDDDE